MGDLFEPTRSDGRSQWRVVFDLFDSMQPGEQVETEAILTALGITDRTIMYRAIGRAKRELWASREKSVDSIKGYGYRVLHADEMTKQALAYKRRSRRQLNNAVAVASATNVTALNGEALNEALQTRRALMVLAHAMDRTIAKVNDHEQRIARLEGRAE